MKYRSIAAIATLGILIGSCKSDPLVLPDPSGSGGAGSTSSSIASSSSGESSSASSGNTSSASSSSGQGSGGSGPVLPCDPCENVDGSRLVRRRTKIIGSDGLEMYQGFDAIYDTTKQFTCSSSTAEDGIVRCMPVVSAHVGVHFADAACSLPIAFASHSMCNPTAPKYAGEVVSGSTCNDPSKYLIYEVGAEFTGQLYYKSNGVCSSTMPLAGYKYYHLDNKVPPSEFVQLTVQTIP
jgi:hypothetical protein